MIDGTGGSVGVIDGTGGSVGVIDGTGGSVGVIVGDCVGIPATSDGIWRSNAATTMTERIIVLKDISQQLKAVTEGGTWTGQ